MASKGVILKRKTDKAKDEFIAETEPFCQSCGTTSKRLSVAHVISERRCGKEGRDDLRSDKRNFRLLCCCDTNDCHSIWDNKGEEEKKKLSIYDEMMAYIEIEDPQLYKTKMLC